jgi:hypothetical protein
MVDRHVIGRLADVLVYTAQALMAMFVAARVRGRNSYHHGKLKK